MRHIPDLSTPPASVPGWLSLAARLLRRMARVFCRFQAPASCMWACLIMLSCWFSSGCSRPSRVRLLRFAPTRIPSAQTAESVLLSIQSEFRALRRPLLSRYKHHPRCTYRKFISGTYVRPEFREVVLRGQARRFVTRHTQLELYAALFPLLFDDASAGDAALLLAVAARYSDMPGLIRTVGGRYHDLGGMLFSLGYRSGEEPGEFSASDVEVMAKIRDILAGYYLKRNIHDHPTHSERRRESVWGPGGGDANWTLEGTIQRILTDHPSFVDYGTYVVAWDDLREKADSWKRVRFSEGHPTRLMVAALLPLAFVRGKFGVVAREQLRELLGLEGRSQSAAAGRPAEEADSREFDSRIKAELQRLFQLSGAAVPRP